MTKENKPAGVIQFGDGTYHKGGTNWVKPVKTLNAAKTYVSPKKAQSVLDQLVSSYHPSNPFINGAKVISVNLIVVESTN